MAMSVEKSAKTVQEAIDSALQELQASVDDVVIEVLDEGDAGILGIGRKPARVLVTLESATAPLAEEEPVDTTYYGDDEEYAGETETPEETAAVDFVSRVLAGIGIRGQISSYREDSTIFIDVDGSAVGAVTGRRGRKRVQQRLGQPRARVPYLDGDELARLAVVVAQPTGNARSRHPRSHP